jgi:hypothetical protein
MRNTRSPMPEWDSRQQRRKTRPHALHERNPAGSKMLRKWYRLKLGVRGTLKEASKWYANLK